MVIRPVHLNSYEFVVVSALRAQQLILGCIPRVDGDHAKTTTAQMEVAQGHIARADPDDATVVTQRQCIWQR
jgi:DNA-directed RNA polymerase subunit K/omega